MKAAPRLCLVPRLTGLGGPSSFQSRLAQGLAGRGVDISYDLGDPGCSAVLVTGGIYNLGGLAQARRRGARIVQRLDGMNWIHRKRRTGWRHYWRSELNNWVLSFIRRHLAHAIIYQSRFSQNWWERVYGRLSKPAAVVYNGVDLQAWSPHGPGELPANALRLLMVEGHLGGGNETGLENALDLAACLLRDYRLPVELVVAGDVPSSLQGELLLVS
ncbi:MAG: glycosyltransferase, partial [Chloroflexi bacterium]|nr:glycosyltransferase [Chloroflexota bacterium]